MAGYSLVLAASATHEIGSLATKKDRQRIVARIASLAADPHPSGSRKLAGSPDRYRIRQGDYRILYRVDDQARQVTVVKIAHRREVYR